MAGLLNLVSIDRRFARSARIDADLGGSPPLAGYVLQASVEKALRSMAQSQVESGQGAFTWTGPYGGGKSSAALLLASLVAGAEEQRAVARKIVGEEFAEILSGAFPRKWLAVPVTGTRTSLRCAIAESAKRSFDWSPRLAKSAAGDDRDLIDALEAESRDRGVLLLLDELGKLLESEAAAGGDAHLLQDLAERASRSEGRLVVVGILHQSFDQYAERADRDARREWAKVQGRFQDIAFLSGADETVALLGRAIVKSGVPASAAERAGEVAAAVAKRRPADIDSLSAALSAAWPLNPVTAMLLGPISRQRFAQNERSVFGFLSSAEPFAFQEFLKSAPEDATFDPARLWEYLAANFGMALASGVDGSRFSLAFEAIDRASARGTEAHVAVAQSAAVIEFFKNGTGVVLADDFLSASVPGLSAQELEKVVADLVEWAILIRQPRLGGYALFAGSDFDLEDAVARASAPVSPEELAHVPERVGFAAVSAKRHYFRTGALRTFAVALEIVGPEDDVDAVADRIKVPGGASGVLVLLVGDGLLTETKMDQRAKKLAGELKSRNIVAAVGSTWRAFHLRHDAEEILALERVLRSHPQIEGDRIARREIAARISSASADLHQTLESALDEARWRLGHNPSERIEARLPVIATALADGAFPSAPIIRSELLQRDRPSSNARAALRDLCHAMVESPHLASLGMSGYPAEMGLYLTLLQPLGLHREGEDGVWKFSPPESKGDGASLVAAWKVIEDASGKTLDEVYGIWGRTPYGIKAGVMPALALAYLLSSRDTVAVYLDDLFQPDLDDVVVDRLLQRPAALRVKHIDRSVEEAAFLARLAERNGVTGDTGALSVARELFSRMARLTNYAKRTERSVGATAIAIRNAILQANDPEALLFEALPAAVAPERPSAEVVMEAIEASEGLYPTLLNDIRTALARALGTSSSDFHGVAERAASIAGLTNDYAFEAFAMRAAAFDGGNGDIEGLSSLLVHKPAHSWSDRDCEQALVELARFGRRFRELEALAAVRDRRSNTEAVALVVGVDPTTPPLLSSFELTDDEKAAASLLARDVLDTLDRNGDASRLRLAALARAVASLTAELDEA